jgi:hypothetical protein
MKAILNLIMVVVFSMTLQAQVGIGTATPEAALDIFSTTDGLLIPRVALTLETSPLPLTAPSNAELVFNTAVVGTLTPGFYYWSTAGVTWVRIGDTVTPPPPPPSFGGWLLAGNAAVAADFIGTTNSVDVAFRRFSLAAGKISTSNTSYGLGALASGSVGEENTAIGVRALGSISSGGSRFNTAIGYQALRLATSVSNSVAIGANALIQSTAGPNTAVGHNALQGNTGSSFNTAVGAGALNNEGGSNNTAIGNGAGFISGSNSVYIGAGANTTGSGINNIVIGFQASAGTASNRIQIGSGPAQTAIVNAAGWTTTSDRRLKSDIKDSPLGLDFIKIIRPVSYYRNDNKDQKTEFGFIAQELDEALKNAGITNTSIINKTADNMFAVRYNDFLPMTVKAVQEQQVIIEKLLQDNKELKAANATILQRLEALENK